MSGYYFSPIWVTQDLCAATFLQNQNNEGPLLYNGMREWEIEYDPEGMQIP